MITGLEEPIVRPDGSKVARHPASDFYLSRPDRPVDPILPWDCEGAEGEFDPETGAWVPLVVIAPDKV